MNTPMAILWLALIFVQLVVATYLLQPVLLLLIYAVYRLFGIRTHKSAAVTGNKRYGVVITAHKELAFIAPIVDSLLKQTYPHFHVYVVADCCGDTSSLVFDDPRVRLLIPPDAFNNKTRSILFALSHFDTSDEVVVILDPDNLVHPRFLEKIDVLYGLGYQAVQGNLQSKNVQGTYAQIDSLGVLFGNFVDREVRAMMGIPANIWGTGMSVDKKVYERIVYDQRAMAGGFDKRLQARLVHEVRRIGYAKDAIVYDEKVETGPLFERQRTRWIRAYFTYFSDSISLWLTGLRKLDVKLSFFGYNLMRPPYFLLLLSAFFFFVIDYLVSPAFGWPWLAVLVLFAGSFFTIVSVGAYDRKLTRGVWFVPLIIYHQTRSLFRVKFKSRIFLKTDHSHVMYIDELLKNQAS